ncbi:MAG: alpha-glucosidase [Spirochaetales bacterium]|nr:alpha-glucosidase [Spirochaetales bacterium]
MNRTSGQENTGTWWRETTVYQIYPRSFMDSNGDGIGDIKGIISKLDYIKDTGFETIWVSPFFASPQRDFGYDISDYLQTAAEYGTEKDVEDLISEVHSRGMYIIFDMVLNHTSDRHPWFLESRSSLDNPKRGWYVWKDGKKADGQKPPNNWRSQVSGSGWHWDEKTQQWYWAAFLPFQPDLNYRNPEVRAEIFKMLEFWLNKGVDGFRLDIIGSIFEDENFRDSPFILKLFPDELNDGMFFRSTCMTQNLPESENFVKDLRKLLDRFDSPERFMVGETFGTSEVISRFCKDGGLHSAFAFECTAVPFNAPAFRRMITEYERCFPFPLLPVWAFSNHDRSRRFSALGRDRLKAKLNTAFQLTIRGLPFFYFGEEIGMSDAILNHHDSLDPVSFPFKKLPRPLFNLADRKVFGALNRDKERTPMQWNDRANAGFTTGDALPWLPVSPDYQLVNVENEAKNPDSLYNCFKRFLDFRKGSPALRRGSLRIMDEKTLPHGILGYIREDIDSGQQLIILLNFKNSEVIIPATAMLLQTGTEVLLSTETEHPAAPEAAGEITLSAFEAIILG